LCRRDPPFGPINDRVPVMLFHQPLQQLLDASIFSSGTGGSSGPLGSAESKRVASGAAAIHRSIAFHGAA